MEEWSKSLAYSGNWYKLIGQVTLDKALTFAEFQVLRDAADSRLDALILHYGSRPELELVQESVKLTAQTLQASCLNLQVSKSSPQERQRLKEALDYQIIYLQACLNRCFDHY